MLIPIPQVHRAVNDSRLDRYSIAYFRCCNFDTLIKNLVVSQVDKYEPVLAGEHMLRRVVSANSTLDER